MHIYTGINFYLLVCRMAEFGTDDTDIFTHIKTQKEVLCSV